MVSLYRAFFKVMEIVGHTEQKHASFVMSYLLLTGCRPSCFDMIRPNQVFRLPEAIHSRRAFVLQFPDPKR